MDINKVIDIVRQHKLNEMMVAGTGGFSANSDPKGPVAGTDVALGKKRPPCLAKGKMKGARTRWKKGCK